MWESNVIAFMKIDMFENQLSMKKILDNLVDSY